MSTCEHCQTTDHAPEGCANHNAPIINKTCRCRCGRPGFDPAPYWSAIAAQQTP